MQFCYCIILCSIKGHLCCCPESGLPWPSLSDVFVVVAGPQSTEKRTPLIQTNWMRSGLFLLGKKLGVCQWCLQHRQPRPAACFWMVTPPPCHQSYQYLFVMGSWESRVAGWVCFLGF